MHTKTHDPTGRRRFLQGGAGLGVLAALGAQATPRIPAVATFSIVGDLVQRVGGDRLDLTVLVGPGADSHVFRPSPSHAKAVRQAQLLFSNGLGYEPWIGRLMQAAPFKGRHVVVGDGIPAIESAGGHGHHHGHSHGNVDPHAWQDVRLVQRYVQRIAEGLCAQDPAGCAVYRRQEQAYLRELERLDEEIREAWRPIPAEQRRVITSHDAFAYYGRAYGVRFMAAQGSSTGSEASVQGIARLVRQIQREQIRALFVENVSDPRLIEQIARETGLRPSGTLFSDSLTGPDGAAPTYLDLMRHNTRALVNAVRGRPGP